MQDWLNELLARVTTDSPEETWREKRRRKQAAGGIRQKVFTREERIRFEQVYGPSRWSVINRGGIYYQFNGFEEI